MDFLTTRKATERVAELAGEPINVQKFFRLAAQHNVKPVVEGAGIRGPKFWHPLDVDRLAERIANGTAA